MIDGMTRREFLKGAFAAAVYLSIPASVIAGLYDEANAADVSILWISPDEYKSLGIRMKPEQRFIHTSLGGYDHLLFRGHLAMPYEGVITKEMRPEELLGAYEGLKRFLNT